MGQVSSSPIFAAGTSASSGSGKADQAPKDI